MLRVGDDLFPLAARVAALDAQACAIVAARAKLTPAIGLDGKPTRDAITGKVHWELP